MARFPAMMLALLLLAGPAGAAAGSRELRVDGNGRIGVDLEEAPLEWLLPALGEALGVEVTVDGSLSGTVSARFAGVAPAHAVRRLVGARPLLMRWTVDGALRSIRVRGERTPVLLAITSTEGPPRSTPIEQEHRVPPGDAAVEIDAASLRALDRGLAQRVRAMQTGWRRAAEEAAVDEVTADDPAARRGAIRALAQAGDGAAVVGLGELLERERDPALRRLAIGALAGIDDPRARDLLQNALQ
jgi:type II secretory pathway component GspD/PulD (secretin)